MPADKTIDTVLLIISLGMLTMGLGSMLLGWLLRQWDRLVSRFAVEREQIARQTGQTGQTAQTDRQTDDVSEADRWLDRLEVDRTKTALIELLVYSGWDVGQIRGVVKGDNGAIGLDIDAAKKRLGMLDEPRLLRVRDDQGERMIPIER